MSYYSTDKGALVDWAAHHFARLYREGGANMPQEMPTREDAARQRAIGLMRSQQFTAPHISRVTGIPRATICYIAKKSGFVLPRGQAGKRVKA